MFNYSHLKYPPIKPQKLPKYLIFHSLESRPPYHIFYAISTKTGENVGTVICIPRSILHNCKRINSVYVDVLLPKFPNHGIGTTLLNFVQAFSKNSGCEGRFHLTSSNGFAPHRVPHIFYRKYGMTTGIKKYDKKIDKFIKKGKNATYKDFRPMHMYYPQEKDSKKTFLQKLSSFIIKSVARLNSLNENLLTKNFR